MQQIRSNFQKRLRRVTSIAEKLHKHFVLTIGRSGSNTLVDMLNQNPAVLNYGEVLGEWNAIRKMQRRLGVFRNDDARYLDALLGSAGVQWSANSLRSLNKIRRGKSAEIKKLSDVRTIGVKEFSLNLRKYCLADYLQTRKDIKVVSLVRENVLARMISNAFLEATGVVLSKKSSRPSLPRKRSLRLDPDQVLANLEVVEAENKELRTIVDALDSSRCFQLGYEDLYTDETHTRDKMYALYEFLGVPAFTPDIRMKKLANKDPLAAIENSNDVREVICGTRFERFLTLE